MKIRLIVLEDNNLLRKAIVMLLKGKDHECYDFADPDLCPVYLKKNCPCQLEYACADIVITDIKMPRTSGMKFIRNQKKRNCKIPHKIMMSGYWTTLLMKEAKELNCMIVDKPFENNEFLELIEKCEKQINPDRKLLEWSKIKEIIDSE